MHPPVVENEKVRLKVCPMSLSREGDPRGCRGVKCMAYKKVQGLTGFGYCGMVNGDPPHLPL
jgi:hypothetical protein